MGLNRKLMMLASKLKTGVSGIRFIIKTLSNDFYLTKSRNKKILMEHCFINTFRIETSSILIRTRPTNVDWMDFSVIMMNTD